MHILSGRRSKEMESQGHEHPSINFLKSLYRNCDQGFVNIRFLPSAKNIFIPLSEIDTIPSFLESHKYEDAYFAVATRENKEGTKQGITQIPALWVDLDWEVASNAKGGEDLYRIFFDFPLEPTLINLSGGGIHAYWRLKEPDKKEDSPKVEELLKRLASFIGADTGATDVSRILRIPGTFNYKYDPAREVEIWHLTENEYNRSDFEFLPSIDTKDTKTDTEGSTHPKGWERELLEGVPQGERNTTIARLTGRYLNKGLSREEVLPILLDINSRNKPPLNETEVEHTLDSIIKTHQRSLPNKIEDKTQKDRRIHYHLTTLDEVFEYPQPTYLVNPILIEGTVSVLGAYTGTGKSIAALSIIKSILTGEPLWGKYHVIKTGPVLLIDEETPQSFLRERTSKMEFASGLPLYLLHFQDVRLDRDDFFNALMEKIEEVKPTLVVIDSLIRVHRLKEDDAVAMSLVVGRLRKIANYGTTLLVIHHHKKGEGPLAQKLRGSSDIPGGVDIEYALLPIGDYLVFKSVKTRTQPLTPIKLKMEANDEQIRLTYQGIEVGEEEEILEEVVNILEENGEQGVEKIFKSLRERGLKIGINRLREILKSANGKELLEERGPKGKRIYKVNPAS
jgi:hypothetical protein